jgi:hypothetical protein
MSSFIYLSSIRNDVYKTAFTFHSKKNAHITFFDYYYILHVLPTSLRCLLL